MKSRLNRLNALYLLVSTSSHVELKFSVIWLDQPCAVDPTGVPCTYILKNDVE